MAETTPVLETKANWDNTGNIFWLGNDLSFTELHILNGSAKNKILLGFRQAIHHLACLDLEDSDFYSKLQQLQGKTRQLSENDLTPPNRRVLYNDVRLIKGGIARYFVSHQLNFVGYPADKTL